MMRRVVGRSAWLAALAVFASVACGCASAEAGPESTAPDVPRPAAQASAARPLPSQPILPGFEPLRLSGNKLSLYRRTINWDNAFLPGSFTANNSPLAGLALIITDSNGRETTLRPSTFRWVDATAASVTVEASAQWQGLDVTLRAIVEYDGVVDVRLTLDADRPVRLRGLQVQARVAQNPHTTVLGFKAKGIRRQKDRKDRMDLPYRGEFIHAIDIADGDRSFWWFADNNKGWLHDGRAPVTELVEDRGDILLRQHLVAGSHTIRGKREIRFGLLATPIRAIDPAQRVMAATAKGHSRVEQALGTTFKLWWPTAFAYDAFPYTTHVAGTDGLKTGDVYAYPGVERNLKRVREGREKFDFHWIPYFSAHAVSMLDPEMAKRRATWEVLPRKVFKDGLNPYSNAYDKPVVTHNAPGYSEYVLSRVDALIDELDVEGIYLDHGPPHDSNNPRNGGWQDDSGNWQPSLDIFAMRDFMKRLRTLFVDKGRAGYTFIHISNREILPAYTYAYGIVDGEQYRKRLKEARYLDLLPLDEFRARFSSQQYGVPNYWLYVDWTNHRGDKSYDKSARQTTEFRRVMALALLHDLPLWHHREDRVERERLAELLNALPIQKAQFRGYWRAPKYVESSNDNVKISQYRHGDRVLNVIANVNGSPQTARIQFADGSGSCRIEAFDRALTDPWASPSSTRQPYSVTLQPYDYQIVTLDVSAACRADPF